MPAERAIRPTSTTGKSISSPSPFGPFAGARWPADKPLEAGAFLFDDGSSLQQIEPNGQGDVIWRHPPADVTGVAVAADRKEVLLTVSPQHSAGAGGVTGIAYLLAATGEVKTLDVVRGGEIGAPSFASPPWLAKSKEIPFWSRLSETIDEHTGRLVNRVMLFDDGIHDLQMPLRYQETYHRVYGYTGGGGQNMALSLVRRRDTPTRFEILFVRDGPGHGVPNGIFDYATVANTDSPSAVAWIAPATAVIAVSTSDQPRPRLDSVAFGCEDHPKELVRSGVIDPGTEQIDWSMIAGDGGVYVLLAEDVAKAGASRPPWYFVDTSGKLSKTAVNWQDGAWTFMQAGSSVVPARC